MGGADSTEADQLFIRAQEHPNVESVQLRPKGNHKHLLIKVKPGTSVTDIEKILQPNTPPRRSIKKNVST